MICVLCGERLYLVGSVWLHLEDLPPVLPVIRRRSWRPVAA